jgi:hypothetical protein
MSLLREKQRKIYDKILSDYTESNQSKSIETCCNDHGITKQTFYNYQKKFDNSQTRSKPRTKSIFTSKSSSRSSSIPRGSLTKHDITSRDVDIELIPTTPKKYIKNSKNMSKKDKWEQMMKEADEVLNMK